MNGIASAFARAAAAAAAARATPPTTASTPVIAPAPWVRDDRYRMALGALIGMLMVLMIVPENFDYRALDTELEPSSGGALSRLIWLTLLGLGSLFTVSRPALAWLVLRRLNFFLLAFVVLALASVAWSIEPAVTARRMIRLVTVMIAAMAFVLMAWHARRFQNVLRPIITAVLLGSILFGLAWPGLAIHHEPGEALDGAWRGLTNHKNSLGNLACIGLLFWFHAWLSREVRGLPALVCGSVAVACLVLSRSTTSVVVTVFILLYLLMLLRSPPALRRYMPWLVALFVGALVGYSLAVLQIIPGMTLLTSPLSAITGKDMTFTGRTEIWNVLGDHIQLHPWLGTGYGAYWTGPVKGADSYDFIQRLAFYPGSAHNGYLEILNDLGALGLLALFGYLSVFAVQALRLLPADRIQAALYLALFMQQAITNLSESRWLSALSVDFVIMTLATAALARGLLEHQLRQQLSAAPRVVQAVSSPAGAGR